MNKKFSTLMMMALIGAGTLSSSAFAQEATTAVAAKINGAALKAATSPDGKDVKTWANGPYFIVADIDNDGVAEAGELMLQVVLGEDDLLDYTTVVLDEDRKIEDLDPLSWKFAETITTGNFDASKTYYYTLTNVKTATLLTADENGKVYDNPSKCSHNGTSQFARFTIKGDGQFKQGKDATTNVLNLNLGSNALPLQLNAGGVKIATDATGSNLLLCTLESMNMDAADAVKALNDVKGGAGFNLTFSLDNKNEWANDILSDLNLKAFEVKKDIVWDKISDEGQPDAFRFTIPAGVYFATEYPASLNNKTEILDEEDFYATTFLAIDPDVCNTTVAADRKKGIGFGLKTVKGSDFNFYTEQKDDQASVKGDVYVGNASFTVVKPDLLGNPEVYNFKVNDARVLNVSSDTKHAKIENLYIGSLVASNKNYLATTKEASKALALKTANTTLYDVTELLKSEDAPSIYTIQFVSELYKDEATNFAGEKNQYLTVGEKGLYTVVDINATDPQYQFVITDVDKEAKTVTFANRQTRETVEVSLYENEDGSYTVYNKENQSLYIESFDEESEENGKVEFNNNDGNGVTYNLQGTKVILTPVTVEDKFASFVNRADDAGLVTFELAKNVDDAAAFYVGAKRNNDGSINKSALLGYTNEKNMTQFELVKVGDAANDNKPFNILNSYVYKNGSRVLTSTAQDTVAYYKYAIKVFGEEIDYYVTSSSYALSQSRPAAAFIIKNNLDGSVSLINDDDEFAAVKAKENGEAAWESEEYYDLPNVLNEGLKTFMVGEDPVYSYEAVPQHVSFEAVRGGFLTKDENNDARLAIANVAAEDLTFWLDTVHSDKNIPSFYILKNGAFMYNAADSVANNLNGDRFSIDDKVSAKLIFKAGELVTSDTLRTTVDGQSVLVAEKDNAPLKIKGGLKNFQFQIVQSEKGSDEYVIRQLNGGYQYVRQVNNYLTLTGDKDEAYRFVIEKQAAPTANEGIEVSEVKVIAGNGQITIMGAAGKQVVVSNILGKVVANQTISSDNATIAVPAGIVAVAVEGEAAVKAIVK